MISEDPPRFGAAERGNAEVLISLALAEDLGPTGDLTAQATIPSDAFGAARFVTRAFGVLAGLPVVGRLAARSQVTPGTTIEIEVDSLEQLDRALACAPDIILVDNLGPKGLAEAVRRRDAQAPGVLLEASGGVSLATVAALARTRVDRISVGALTHSAPAL